MIDDIKGFAKAINDLSQIKNLDDLVYIENDKRILSANSNNFLNNVDDDSLIELLEAVELSASYFLFDDYGNIDKSNIKLLNKQGVNVYSLDESFLPFTMCIDAIKFNILYTD